MCIYIHPKCLRLTLDFGINVNKHFSVIEALLNFSRGKWKQIRFCTVYYFFLFIFKTTIINMLHEKRHIYQYNLYDSFLNQSCLRVIKKIISCWSICMSFSNLNRKSEHIFLEKIWTVFPYTNTLKKMSR